MTKPSDTPPSPVELFGNNFFSSECKLDIGIWIAQQEIGLPFSVQDAREALAHRNFPVNHEQIVRRFMPSFEDALLVEKTRATYGTGMPHLWEKLGNPWWEVFEVAGRLAAQ